ncbi:hypothetical protein DFJ74DRAFT_683085 [Hyaloraphidium curvatum]|nr:hypothetical protein DFJ74DRAFT_683085 [Hyaloraphidium curvatum]
MSARTGKEVAYHVQMKVKPGKLKEYEALMEEMSAAVEKDKLSIDYSWYVTDDGSEVHIYERYQGVEGCMEHNASFAPFAARFMGCADFGDFWVFGDVPTDGDGAKLREGLKGLNAKFLGKFGSGGFSK